MAERKPQCLMSPPAAPQRSTMALSPSAPSNGVSSLPERNSIDRTASGRHTCILSSVAMSQLLPMVLHSSPLALSRPSSTLRSIMQHSAAVRGPRPRHSRATAAGAVGRRQPPPSDDAALSPQEALLAAVRHLLPDSTARLASVCDPPCTSPIAAFILVMVCLAFYLCRHAPSC